ncbi:hypothetical protein R1flu_020880 [Riccia fluitans]|uniref:Uncharacterized protein n=1 Tax=Riccia fluitans TaxID=41844 RepID=A0ABD1ZN90_9MARC
MGKKKKKIYGSGRSIGSPIDSRLETLKICQRFDTQGESTNLVSRSDAPLPTIKHTPAAPAYYRQEESHDLQRVTRTEGLARLRGTIRHLCLFCPRIQLPFASRGMFREECEAVKCVSNETRLDVVGLDSDKGSLNLE